MIRVFISFVFESVNLSILQKTINKTSTSPHAIAMCSIRTNLLKQENEKIEFADLSRLQFTSDESELVPDCIWTPMMKEYWGFDLHLCQEQLGDVRVSQLSSCFSWDD